MLRRVVDDVVASLRALSRNPRLTRVAGVGLGPARAVSPLVLGCSWTPVRRALSVDPIIVLREE